MPQDESRPKTLKFLVLRMAKSFKSTDQVSFDAALRTLQIIEEDDYWKFSVTVNEELRSVLAKKNSFSLYQTRQIEKSDVDPGVKNQLSAIKVLIELFNDLNLTHHQYNAQKRYSLGEFLVKNYGLTILIYLVTLGLFAIILSAPWLILFSVLAHLIAIHFFVKNKSFLFILSLVYILLPAIAIKLDLELNALAFTLSSGLLLCSYLLQTLSRNAFIHNVLITFFLFLTLYLYFNVHQSLKESFISPAIFCLLILGLCFVIEKRLKTVARILALTLFSLTFACLLFFGLAQSFWVLPVLMFACLQALLLVVVGSEKPAVRILVGFPLIGAIL